MMSKLPLAQGSDAGFQRPPSLQERNRIELEATFERRWLQKPEQFNPRRSARTEVENERLLALLPIQAGKRALDLGTGYGTVAETLEKGGMKVDALDIAQNALKRLHLPTVRLIKDYFPYTKLDDGTYDLIVAANLIAEIPEGERRVALSEISRLLAPQGTALLSTPIDIHSEDALVRFLSLLETEFAIDRLVTSHHSLAIRFPYFKHSRRFLSFLESFGTFFWQDQSISHVIALLHKRPLNLSVAPVIESKPRKTVWE